MSKILNGRDASTMLAHSVNELVYSFSSTPTSNLTQTNIWNKTVKTVRLDPLQDSLSHVVHSIAEGHVTTAIMPSSFLLSSLPYLYKLAEDKSSVVIHVSAGHCGSFADFTQVMSVRESGVAFLSASSVQEVYDLSLITQVASLLTSVPFLTFFDCRRISDELSSIQLVEKDHLLEFFPQELIDKYRGKCVSETGKESEYLKYKVTEERSVDDKGEVTGPRVYDVVKDVMIKFSDKTGRLYYPLEYTGHFEAEFIIVSMGAAATVVEKTLNSMQELYPQKKFGSLKIRLYRPFPDKDLISALPSTVKNIAVLEPVDDRNSCWNPLFLDIAAAYQTVENNYIEIVSGRYGLNEEVDFSPEMVLAIYRGLECSSLQRCFDVASLDRSGIQVGVIMPPDTEQLIFIESHLLAISFAQLSNKNIQVYTRKHATHVRLTKTQGSLLPSLIQSADAVVIPTLPLTNDANQASIEAIESLSDHGHLIIGSPCNIELSLPANIKKSIYRKQIKIVTIKNLHSVFTQHVSISSIFSSEECTIYHIPNTWAEITNYSFMIVSETPASPENSKDPLPVETPYIKALDQVFGSRLNIYNAYQYDSIWSPNKSSANSATPEFGYGRLINRIQDRARFVNLVIEIIQKSSTLNDEIRILSQWLLLVNSPQCSFKVINEAADLVTHILPSFPSLLPQKELLYETSNWLIGSDVWSIDLGLSGLHHVITSGENVNILIIDTTPYTSQVETEKRKKDVGLYAMNFGSVYVASVALYSSYTGVLQALMEADAYKGPSIVLGYLPQLSRVPDPISTLKETKISVDNGSWPLYRWNPELEEGGREIFRLDSQCIKKDLEEFLARENYLSQLVSSHPDISRTLVSSLENVRSSYIFFFKLYFLFIFF